MPVLNYRELIVWQRAMDLVEGVYRIGGDWPHTETYGFINQVRRACVSVPANIAEGQGRVSAKEFLHHLSFAHGSLREVETHLLIAVRLRFCALTEAEPLMEQAAEVGRLLRGSMRSLPRD